MAELPLFPLHTVLFPGMMLPLYIFEERYKLMINRCIEQKSPFGVVFVPESGQGDLPFPFHSIGTMAHVTNVERLEQGRMNIMALGRQRFKVERVLSQVPYHLAQVSLYPVSHHHRASDQLLAAHVHEHLVAYAELLMELTGGEVSLTMLPDSLTTLAHLTAILLQVPLREKQALLEMESYHDILLAEEELLRRERSLLGYMIATQAKEAALVNTGGALYAPRPSRN